ncbi:rod-binding protein [Hydrogenimonas sp.]
MRVQTPEIFAAAATPILKPADDREALRRQTDAFEAIIVKQMLDIALKSDDPLLPKDPGRDIYRSMMNEERSKQLSGAFGYSQLIFDYLVSRET